MSPGIKAIQALAKMGYRTLLEAGDICLRWDAKGQPDLDQMQPLLDTIKANKTEVLDFLGSCSLCSHFVAKEIEPDYAAFCLWWGEGLLAQNPSCKEYQEGQVPAEPISCPRCGGVVFCPDLEGKGRCLACDWEYLTSIYPGLKFKT